MKACPHCEREFALQSTLNKHLDECAPTAKRIAELETAARRAIKIIETNYLHQREKVPDAASILRAALGE